MKGVLLVVLYKETLESSRSIKSYLECKNYHKKIKLVIWDNSPTRLTDFSCLDNLHIDFLYNWSPENKPLSHIYNSVVSSSRDSDVLFLFDQDSLIENEYFIKAFAAINKYSKIKLFIPYVEINNIIVSPGYFKLYKGNYFKKLKFGRMNARNTLAITSGMAIRMSTFDELLDGFDTNLSFYGIDTQFCFDYAKYNKHLYIFNYSLSHNFSQFVEEEKNVKLMRMKKYKQSSLYILKKKSWYSYLIALIVWNIKFVLFSINPRFLKNKV